MIERKSGGSGGGRTQQLGEVVVVEKRFLLGGVLMAVAARFNKRAGNFIFNFFTLPEISG